MIQRTASPPVASGFTIVELLVSIAIVGLLTALILPAVQRVRESSRNTDCRNRLHQFGLAMHEHEAAHRAFPTSRNVALRITEFIAGSPAYWKCPSDHRFDDGGSYTSYLVNDGVVMEGYNTTISYYRRGLRDNGFSIDPPWPIPSRDTKASEITDGLSNTVAVAERLLIPPTDGHVAESDLLADSRRYFWRLPASYPAIEPLISDCRGNRLSLYPIVSYTSGAIFGFGYDHTLGPNEFACTGSGSLGDRPIYYYLNPASSEHPGLVNVLMGDGSVRSVAESVDLTVWRAIGTRNGNETIGEF